MLLGARASPPPLEHPARQVIEIGNGTLNFLLGARASPPAFEHPARPGDRDRQWHAQDHNLTTQTPTGTKRFAGGDARAPSMILRITT